MDGNPVNWVDPEGMSPAGLVVKFSKKTWNHVFKRHVNRKAFPGKSKFRDPSSIQKNVEKTVKNFDRLTPQNNGRLLYEKDFGKEIGTKGETIQRAVIDRYDNMVTTFPSNTFKAITIGLLSLLNPFDAISGELADPEEDIDGNGIPDYMEKKPNLDKCD